MIQAGIKRVVAPACPDHLKDRWEDTFIRSRKAYAETGVEVSEISFDR
jgi:hypothetical protein